MIWWLHQLMFNVLACMLVNAKWHSSFLEKGIDWLHFPLKFHHLSIVGWCNTTYWAYDRCMHCERNNHHGNGIKQVWASPGSDFSPAYAPYHIENIQSAAAINFSNMDFLSNSCWCTYPSQSSSLNMVLIKYQKHASTTRMNHQQYSHKILCEVRLMGKLSLFSNFVIASWNQLTLMVLMNLGNDPLLFWACWE